MVGTQRGRSTIIEIDPTVSEEWDALLRRFPHATLFHSSGWMQALARTYGLAFRATVLKESGRIVAGVPWVAYRGISGTRKVSLPFSDFCDVLARDSEEAQVLVEHVLSDEIRWKLCASADCIQSFGMEAEFRGEYKRQGIALTPSEDALWDALAGSARRNIRKAEREHVEMRVAQSLDELREWYLLHLRVRKYRYRLLAQPFRFFKELWERYVDRQEGLLLLAVHSGKVIGGDLVLMHGKQAYYKFNASDPDYLWARPNDLLMWTGILEAKRLGYERFDLGRTPVSNPGLMTFKRHFGTVDEDINVVEFVPRGEESDPAEQEARVLLNRLTELFVDDSAPDSLTESAGEVLYPYFA